MHYFRCPQCGRGYTTFDQIHNAAPYIQKQDFVLLESEKREFSSCPHCDSSMKPIGYYRNLNVLLDKCPTCGWYGFNTLEVIKVFQGIENRTKREEFLQRLSQDIKRDTLNRMFLSDASIAAKKLVRPGLIAFPIAWSFFLPISAERENTKFPYATIGLIFMNIIVFTLILSIGNPLESAKTFLLWPEDVRRYHNLYQLVSSTFLHATILHLFFNMYFLWLFGTSVEEKLGNRDFILFYILAGVLSNVGFLLINRSNTLPSLGASGAISGILGAYLVLFPYRKVKILFRIDTIDIPAVFFLGFFIFFQLIYTFLSTKVLFSNINYSAHISGFAVGVFFTFIWKRTKTTRGESHGVGDAQIRWKNGGDR